MPKIIIKLSVNSLNKITDFINTLNIKDNKRADSLKTNLVEFYKDEYKNIHHIKEHCFIKSYLLATEFVFANYDVNKLIDNINYRLTDFFKEKVSKLGREYVITEQNNTSFDNSIDYWFNEVNKELVKTVDFNNDDFDIIPENRDLFIRKNLRLVINCAKRYRYNCIPFEDLIQTGNIGLIKAYDHYDTSRSNVRKKIINYINSKVDKSWTSEEVNEVLNNNIKYNSNAVKIIYDNIPDSGFNSNESFIDWCNTQIKAASLPSLAFLMIRAEILVSLSSGRQVNIPYNKLADGFTNFISLDQENPKTSLQTNNSLMFDKANNDFFIDNDEKLTPEDQETTHNLLLKYLGDLEPEERYILTEYYGLNTDGECDINVLADKVGLTPRQLQKNVKNICKNVLNKIPKAERDYINELF